MKKTIIISQLLIIFSCTQKNPNHNDSSLYVDIKKQHEVSVFDLFSHIEVIPLETLDSSLLKNVNKVLFHENNYYILDIEQHVLLRFDIEGKFISQIAKAGDGPEDYINLSDFFIEDQYIFMLSPMGIVYKYDLDGRLLDKIYLEGKSAGYHKFARLDDDKILFWSSVGSDTEQLSLFSSKENKIISYYYKDHDILNNFTNDVFYSWNNMVYFYKPFHNEIRSIKDDNLTVNYQWDFKENNTGVKNIDFTENNPERLLNALQSLEIPYFFNMQAQTNHYYYAQLISGLKNTSHIFYNKQTGSNVIFKKFKEDLHFNPVYWHEDYVIGITNPFYSIDKMISPEMIDDIGKSRFFNLKEDDNPCLIKYHFKMNK